jgi:hypothetical protein
MGSLILRAQSILMVALRGLSRQDILVAVFPELGKAITHCFLGLSVSSKLRCSCRGPKREASRQAPMLESFDFEAGAASDR